MDIFHRDEDQLRRCLGESNALCGDFREIANGGIQYSEISHGTLPFESASGQLMAMSGEGFVAAIEIGVRDGGVDSGAGAEADGPVWNRRPSAVRLVQSKLVRALSHNAVVVARPLAGVTLRQTPETAGARKAY